MAGKKKLPAGIIYTEGHAEPYGVRPWDRETRTKGQLRRFSSLSAAVAYKEAVDSGKIRKVTKNYTCDQWVEHWTTAPGFKRPKESTNLTNAERVGKFARDFRGIPMTSVDRAAAREWAAENSGRLGAVRAMFTDARLDGVVAENPFTNLRLPGRTGRKYIEPLTPAEVKELAGISDKKWPEWPVLSAMILFSAYSGVRLGECLALRWKDIDWQAGTILVERQWAARVGEFTSPKNDRARTIALLEPAATALRTLDQTMSPDGLLWYSPSGKIMRPPLHHYYWRQVVAVFNDRTPDDRAAAIDLEWHALRHFTASWMVDKGIQPHDVAGQLGHTDGGKLVSDLYGHLYKDNSISRIQASLAA